MSEMREVRRCNQADTYVPTVKLQECPHQASGCKNQRANGLEKELACPFHGSFPTLSKNPEGPLLSHWPFSVSLRLDVSPGSLTY